MTGSRKFHHLPSGFIKVQLSLYLHPPSHEHGEKEDYCPGFPTDVLPTGVFIKMFPGVDQAQTFSVSGDETTSQLQMKANQSLYALGVMHLLISQQLGEKKEKNRSSGNRGERRRVDGIEVSPDAT